MSESRICRKCVRPLGPLDGPALDAICLVCRLETVLGYGEIAVVGLYQNRQIAAVEYLESRRVAQRLAYAWKRAKLEVQLVERSEEFPLTDRPATL